MNIIFSKKCRFCFGVKRAVETVYKEAEKKSDTDLYLWNGSSIMKRLLQILKKRCAGHPFD